MVDADGGIGEAAAGHRQQIARRGIVDSVRAPALHQQAVKCPVGVEDVDTVGAGVGHCERATPSRMGGRGGRRARLGGLQCGGRRRWDVPRRRGRRRARAGGQAAFRPRCAAHAIRHAGPRIRRRGRRQRRGELRVAHLPAAAAAAGVSGGKRSEIVHESAAGVEHLHATVARVGDGDQVAVRRPSDGYRAV